MLFHISTNEIVTFGSLTYPTRERWIVRHPNGMYGPSPVEGRDYQQPGPACDRSKKPPPSEPGRPDEAQGAGHYTSYTATYNITTEMQGLTDVGDTPNTNLGLGLMTYNANGLDFHGLNRILYWTQLGLARCNGREKGRWTAATRAALWPHAKLYMSAIAPSSKQCKAEDRARV